MYNKRLSSMENMRDIQIQWNPARILLSFFFFTLSAKSQDVLRWEKLASKWRGPVARKNAAMGYDAAHNHLVVYGGQSKNAVLSDTWALDLSTSIWRQVNKTIVNSEVIPGPRYGTVHGTNGDKFIVALGNKNFANSPSKEVYEFNLNSSVWNRIISTSGNIEKRYSSIGGIFNGQLYASQGFGKDDLLSDVFEFDLMRKRWNKLHGSVNQYDPLQPHSRYGHCGVILPNEKLLVFGGCLSGKKTAGPCPSGDAWLFDLTSRNWSPLKSCPSPRSFAGMSILPNSSALSAVAVLFGGDDTSNQIIKANEKESDDEVIIFDTLDNKWTYRTVQKDPLFDFPEPRYGHSMATAADGIVVFGGVASRNGKLLGDVWLLKGDVEMARNSPIPRKSCGYTVNLVMLHGIFMFVSWGILLQMSAFVARYFTRMGNKWFKVHRILSVSGLVLAIVGFGLGIASFRGSHFSFVHRGMGLDVMLAGLYQPLNAAFRPAIPKDGEKPSLRRRIWEISHKFTGRIALILALINITLGLFISLALKSVWISWVAYLGMILMVYIIAEVRSRMKSKKMAVTEIGMDNIAM